jgi:predicted MFS family arabinose efflux permease
VGASRAVLTTLSLVAASLLVWPHATSLAGVAVVLVPWALGCFATNSGQQARLGQAAPALAPALMALNTSAMYFGQAAGSSSGGWMLAHGGYAPLSWVGLAFMLAAIAVSVWVGRRSPVTARH